MIAAAVHTQPKSRWNPSAIGASIRAAAEASRGNPGAMIVLHDGRAVGAIRNEGDRAVFARFTQKQWCAFNNYVSIDAATRNGNEVQVYYLKTNSSTQDFQWLDMWPLGGNPGAGDYSGTANVARQFSNTTTGSMWLNQRTPAAGQTRNLAAWTMGHIAAAAATRTYILYDRVLSYDNVTISTTPATMTNTLTAQRYAGSGDPGLLISATGVTAVGATAASLSAMTLTDNLGNTGVSLNPQYTLNWSVTAGTPSTTQAAQVVLPWDTTNLFAFTPWLPRPAGISGVRKIEGFTSSANNTGTACFALVKPIGTIWVGGGGTVQHNELARSMFTLERVFDSACLAMMYSTSTSSL